jgi:hypothetical protein
MAVAVAGLIPLIAAVKLRCAPYGEKQLTHIDEQHL